MIWFVQTYKLLFLSWKIQIKIKNLKKLETQIKYYINLETVILHLSWKLNVFYLFVNKFFYFKWVTQWTHY